MSQESTAADLVEVVQRFSEALGQRDADVAMSLLTPDFVHRPIATFTDSQERGVDEFRRFMFDWWDTWAEDANWRLDTVRAYGEAVVALLRFSGHARASGVEMTGGAFAVFRFRDGEIARIEEFTDRAQALEAAGVAD